MSALGDWSSVRPPYKLISAETARALDQEASASWGLSPFALVEAAGRSCAAILAAAYPGLFPAKPLSGSPGQKQGRPGRSAPRDFPRIVVLAGSGNNGADAMVLLRSLLIRGLAAAAASALFINRLSREGEYTPRSEALASLKKMGVPVLVWGASSPESLLEEADLIIDGIAGTGLGGPLRGIPLEMVGAVNQPTEKHAKADSSAAIHAPLVVAVDVPSGNFDSWEPSMPILRAHATLAIEPEKACLYRARIYAGTILPVEGIFPPALIEAREGIELAQWGSINRRVPPVGKDDYKYRRGVVEIHAGSEGSTGAARIAARGATAAGAGLIRLIADDAIYPILAASAGGGMVVPASAAEVPPGAEDAAGEPPRFKADALLIGPGWGTGADRLPVLKQALEAEARGTPLILDADGILLSRSAGPGGRAATFHGKTILTPHPGELSVLTGIPKEKLGDPELIASVAKEKQAVILFKSHILIIAAEDGRLGIVDGLAPVLANGGTGDLLAGLCAAIAARMNRAGVYDGYTAAAAAGALLMAAAEKQGTVFTDPLDMADIAAAIAGAAWLDGEAPRRYFYG
ncbi:bifunctional NAD(P)H-hydrate repair enzyme [Spirochaetia bacterium]|nr:bifunctional NAD(P)H-hydrate repair enzyme [Spirochaetia bacterium]